MNNSTVGTGNYTFSGNFFDTNSSATINNADGSAVGWTAPNAKGDNSLDATVVNGNDTINLTTGVKNGAYNGLTDIGDNGNNFLYNQNNGDVTQIDPKTGSPLSGGFIGNAQTDPDLFKKMVSKGLLSKAGVDQLQKGAQGVGSLISSFENTMNNDIGANQVNTDLQASSELTPPTASRSSSDQQDITQLIDELITLMDQSANSNQK